MCSKVVRTLPALCPGRGIYAQLDRLDYVCTVDTVDLIEKSSEDCSRGHSPVAPLKAELNVSRPPSSVALGSSVLESTLLVYAFRRSSTSRRATS